MPLIPPERLWNWEPGVDVGVIGGIAQYQPGGINERTDLVDVTASPYFAAGNITETSGTITSGDDEITVASTTDFSVGNYIKVGLPAIQQLEITAGASTSGNITVHYVGPNDIFHTESVSVVAGDSASLVAAKIRATPFRFWSVGGSGVDVVFTQTNAIPITQVVATSGNGTGVTSTGSETQDAVIAVLTAKITNIAGPVITIDGTADNSVTDGIVSHNDYPSIQDAITAATSDQVVYLPAGFYRLDTSLTADFSRSEITIRGDGITDTIIKPYGNTAALVIGSDYINEQFYNELTGDQFRDETYMNLTGADVILAGLPDGGIGAIVVVTILNNTDPDALVVSVAGFPRMRAFYSVITSVDSGGFEIADPLPFDMPLSLEPRASFDTHLLNLTGVEDFKVDGIESTAPGKVGMTQSRNCWFDNVKVVNSANYFLGIGNSMHCEMRRCDVRTRLGSGTNGAGLIFSRLFNSLIEDNIISDVVPNFEINASCTGNVFAFNFCYDSEVGGVIGGSINSNHGPHNSFNLYEGNIGEKFQCDGYYGGASDDTLFRNWFQGTNPFTDLGGYCIQLNRFTRNYNLVANLVGNPIVLPGVVYPDYFYDNRYPPEPANPPFGATDGDYDGHGSQRFCFILGTPNIGQGGFLPYEPTLDPQSPNRFAQATLGDWWACWGGKTMLRFEPPASNNYNSATAYVCDGSSASVVDLVADGPGDITGGNSITQWIADNPAKNGLSTWDTPSATSADWSPISSNSFQEIDKDVINTLIRKGNYNYSTFSIPASESTGGDAVPDSLFRSSAPIWWGMRPWPAFEPTDPSPTNISIPAGQRWEESLDPVPPHFVSEISLTGTAQYNFQLQITGGAAEGVPTPTYTYSWLLDGDDMQEIGTDDTLDLSNPAWIGHFVRGIKIASSASGSAQSFADSSEILPFSGDVLTVTQVPNASPVTELWLRGALTDGVSAPLEYYLVQHSGPYPTQPDNNFVYARFGTPQDNVYVFQGTISEAEAIASVP